MALIRAWQSGSLSRRLSTTLEGAGPLLAVDGDVHLPAAVHPDDVRLDQGRVLRLGHVAEEHDAAAGSVLIGMSPIRSTSSYIEFESRA